MIGEGYRAHTYSQYYIMVCIMRDVNKDVHIRVNKFMGNRSRKLRYQPNFNFELEY